MALRRALLAGLVMLAAGSASAAPPSAITNSLVADVSAAAKILQIADDAALSQSDSRRVRSLAQRDRALQAATLEALAAWTANLRRDEAEEAAAPTIDHLGPVIHAFNGAFRADVPGAQLTGADADMLARLRSRRGADFDAAFLAMHASALRHMLDLYTDYIRNGDDQELRVLSVRQQHKVRAALGQYGRS